MNPLAIRFACIYGAIFLTMGTFMPYFPVWLRAQGLSAIEIGTLFSVSGVLRVVTMPAIAYVADRAGAQRRVLFWLTVGVLAGDAAYLLTDSFWPILGVIVFMTLFGPPILPMTEAMALQVAERGAMHYGRVRLWGSVAFIAANLGVGAALGSLGPDVVLWVIIFGAAMCVWAVASLPADVGRASADLPMVTVEALLRLLRNPAFLSFSLAAPLLQATHAVYYAFGTLHWQSLGIGDTAIGGLWALGVVAEVLLFWLSAPLIARFGTQGLLWLAAGAAVVRWGAMAFDPPLWTLPILQCLHAFTFGAAHLGAMQFLVRAVPRGLAGTAQSVFSALASGIVMSGAMLWAGSLYDRAGGMTYLAMVAVAVLACGALLIGGRVWQGERIDE